MSGKHRKRKIEGLHKYKHHLKKKKTKKVIYLEDFSTLETELVIGGSFEIVFGDGLHGYCCELRKPLGCGCLRDLIKKIKTLILASVARCFALNVSSRL